MASDPKWQVLEVDDNWNAWCMVPGMHVYGNFWELTIPGMHGTWKTWCMVSGMYGAWYLECMVSGIQGMWYGGCEVSGMNGNVWELNIPGMHGTWNDWCMLCGMHGIWKRLRWRHLECMAPEIDDAWYLECMVAGKQGNRVPGMQSVQMLDKD